MKAFLGLSAFSITIFLFTLQTGVTSCTKETISHDTVTVIKKDTLIKKDTVIIKDTALTIEILTANSWKMQEMRGVLGSTNRYYLKGGTSNTESFDNEYITFNQNNTGTYVQNDGTQRSITWSITNGTYAKIVWTLYNTPATFSITWDNIRYKNKSLYYDDYYTDGNLNLNEHSQQIRIPK